MFGCGLSGFGAGLLLGLWLESGFMPSCLGLGLLLFGLSVWFRRS